MSVEGCMCLICQKELAMYTAEVFCRNCGWTGEVRTKKGKLIAEVTCPNCACGTLSSRWKE